MPWVLEEVNRIINDQLLQKLPALQKLLRGYQITIQCHQSCPAIWTDDNKMVHNFNHEKSPRTLHDGSDLCLKNGCEPFKTAYDLLSNYPFSFLEPSVNQIIPRLRNLCEPSFQSFLWVKCTT